MSLRLKNGLTNEIINYHFKNLGIYDIFDKNRLEKLKEENLIYFDQNQVKTTQKGRILTDSIISFLKRILII